MKSCKTINICRVYVGSSGDEVLDLLLVSSSTGCQEDATITESYPPLFPFDTCFCCLRIGKGGL